MLPLSANHQLRYRIDSGFGAVLVVRAPIFHDAFYHESCFKDWVEDNAAVLFSGPARDNILSQGLFIVTQTFYTQEGSLTTWTRPGNTVYVGLDIDVLSDGAIGLQMGWHAGRSDTGWNHFGSQVR